MAAKSYAAVLAMYDEERLDFFRGLLRDGLVGIKAVNMTPERPGYASRIDLHLSDGHVLDSAEMAHVERVFRPAHILVSAAIRVRDYDDVAEMTLSVVSPSRFKRVRT